MDKVGIVLLAIVGMLAWIGLLIYAMVIDWSSKRWPEQATTMVALLGRRAQEGFRHYWQPEYVVRGLAFILLVLGTGFFYLGMNATDMNKFATTFAPNFATDCISLAITILLIDQLYRWRDKVYQQQIDKRIAAERKRTVIQQLASRSNDFALEAARIALVEGWLEDGSLERITLFTPNLHHAHLLDARLNSATFIMANLEHANLCAADLQNANLQMANLRSAILASTNLIGANLFNAKLNNADMIMACLDDAILLGADFSGADLTMVSLLNAEYNSQTKWPDGFDPDRAGAIKTNKVLPNPR